MASADDTNPYAPNSKGNSRERTTVSLQTSPSNVRLKLFVMMVLQFFIWGAWLPLIFGYLPGLGFAPWQQSLILNAFPVAAIVGMFFSNQFADRNFAAERFLSASHLIAGAAMLSLVWTRSFWPFFGAMLQLHDGVGIGYFQAVE